MARPECQIALHAAHARLGGAHGAMARVLCMERSAYAEAGESACTGWVLARLMLPRSGCVHASRALYVPRVGGSDAHTYNAHS